MSSVAFGGLATGMDTASIVSQLVEIRKQPIYRLQTNKKDYQAQISALGTLKSKLQALQKAAQAMDTANEFSSLKASSTDEDVLQVTAGAKAAPGTYTVRVESRAVAQKDRYQAYDSKLDSVGSGVISFTVGGETRQFTLAGYTSLESLANFINDNVDGVGASILYDGNATGGYSLVLTGSEAGTAGAFSADFSGLTGGTAPVINTSTAADDAHLTIDGVAVTSASNLVEDAISGLTMDLRDAAPGQDIYVEVARDNAGIAENVKNLVNAYNDIFSFVKQQSAKDGDLRDNPTLRSVASTLENRWSSAFSDGLGSIGTFSLVGITRIDGRQLEFNEDDFATALKENFGSVRDLFVKRDGNEGKMSQIDDLIDSLTSSTDGIFKSSEDMLNRKIRYADDTIARYQRSVDTYQTTLERKFTAMETMVAQLQAQGSYLSSMGF